MFRVIDENYLHPSSTPWNVPQPIWQIPFYPTPPRPLPFSDTRWKCPDCGEWIAYWVAAHACAKKSTVGGYPPVHIGGGITAGPYNVNDTTPPLDNSVSLN